MKGGRDKYFCSERTGNPNQTRSLFLSLSLTKTLGFSDILQEEKTVDHCAKKLMPDPTRYSEQPIPAFITP